MSKRLARHDRFYHKAGADAVAKLKLIIVFINEYGGDGAHYLPAPGRHFRQFLAYRSFHHRVI